MDKLNKDDIKNLIKASGGVKASLYMPTHQAGAETQQDPIRFKNLLRKAKNDLLETESDLRESDVDTWFEPLWELQRDNNFWQHQSAGLAVFVSEDEWMRYRLPISFDELVMIGSRYHLKPLLALTHDRNFYILALSQNKVRLLQADRYSAREVDLGDTPLSLEEALQYDDPEKQLQYHTETQQGEGDRPAMYHGQGVGTDDAQQKKNILRFFHMLNDGVCDTLREQNDEDAPLVLAGVDYLTAIYEEANSHPNLLKDAVIGNPDELSAEALREKSGDIVSAHFEQTRDDAIAKFNEVVHDDLGATDLEEIVPAAHQGRVAHLFVSPATQKFGVFDSEQQQVKWQEDAGEDLLDLAAVQTFLNGGEVFVLPSEEVPGGGLAAAVFRY